jgi:hypothetical protein
MMTKEYKYCDHIIELHEHPIYHDFEYVIKSLDGKVVAASHHVFEHFDDAQKEAQMIYERSNNC